MPIAVFDYAAWAARYPEFNTTVSEGVADELFAEATLYCNNSPLSVVPADAITYQPRLMLLGMLTAHLAQLYFGQPGQPASGLVGRINSVTQGSVTISAEMTADKKADWYMQTRYGASYWNATRRFRTMRYVPPCRPVGVWR